MKKFIVIFLIFLISCINFTFADTISINDEYLDDEVFNAILFDYKYLTKNDTETCEKYYDDLKNGIKYEKNIKLII